MAHHSRGTKKSVPLNLEGFTRYLETTQPFRESLLHHHLIDEVPAEYAEPEGGLPIWLMDPLKRIGIERLYSHQARAIDLIRRKKNVVMVTPTASGKSLAFNIPILESLVGEPGSRAIYLFPLKALEQDQLARLNQLIDQMPPHCDLSAAIYDGDTSKTARALIRKKMPRILVTNPDMLHYGIMPFHTQFETLFRSLRFIVIDELHTYRGVFGSHILQIFRRIRRLAEFYGSKVQFISASATIENPLELAEALIGEPFELITESGAPQRRKHFMFFNPVTSPYTEAARLMSACIEAKLKTIAFTRSRKITELLYTWVLESNPSLKKRISAYRAGFLPEERRAIEQKLFSGELDGVISTSALEMGIDIGGLDACILVGYPGTITATWQRGGRVGRQDRESLIILIAGPDALDQYFMHNPADFFGRTCERAVVDGDNPEILHNHLVCAAAEVPLRQGETTFDTFRYASDLEQLVSEKRLDRSGSGKQWFASKAMPHRDMDIRSMGPAFTIIDGNGSLIGSVSGRQRYSECHTGAVYLHRGNQYLIEDVDEGRRIIRSRESTLDYYTVPLSEKDTEILATYCQKQVAGFTLNQGRLKVTERIVGYQRKRMMGQELIDQQPLDFPPMTFETIGIWIEIEEEIRQGLMAAGCHYMGSLHGIEHATLSLFPLFVLCDRNDVGGICKPMHNQVQKGVIFMYDGHSGGVGLAARAYEVITELLTRTLHLIETCPCEEGCPSCIHSPKCGSGNKPLDKKGSVLGLKLLLGLEEPAKLVIPGDSTSANPPTTSAAKLRSPVTAIKQASLESPVSAWQNLVLSPADESLPIPGITWYERRKRIIVFDLETQKSSHEVGGWGNSHLMRLSVGVLYDSSLDQFLDFREENVEEFIEHLRTGDLVVGFNSVKFDYAVLRGYSNFDFSSLPTFDICQKVQKAAGKRLSLNQLATATMAVPKSADGLQALAWFKESRFDLITEYCRQDVLITRDLFRFGLINRFIRGYPRQGSDQRITIPLDWTPELESILGIRLENQGDRDGLTF